MFFFSGLVSWYWLSSSSYLYWLSSASSRWYRPSTISTKGFTTSRRYSIWHEELSDIFPDKSWYLISFRFYFWPRQWLRQSGWGIFLLRTEPEERGECLSRMRTLSTLCPCLFWLTSLWAALIAPDVMFCSTALCQPLTEWHNLLVTCHLLIFLVLFRLNVLPARACRTSQIFPLVPSACACVSLSLHFSISLSAGVLTATQIHLSHSLRTSQYVTSPLAGHLTSGFSLARDCSQMSSLIINSWCETNQNSYKWSSTIRGVNWSELRM